MGEKILAKGTPFIGMGNKTVLNTGVVGSRLTWEVNVIIVL